MREFWQALCAFDCKALFVTPTRNGVLQAFRYLFVGGIAFVADWCTMAALTICGMHYLLAVALAFVVGLTVNYFLSKAFVFKAETASVGRMGEFTVYALIGAVGLGLTEVLMYASVEHLHLHPLLSKAIVAVIVLFWNYFLRKLLLYRGRRV